MLKSFVSESRDFGLAACDCSVPAEFVDKIRPEVAYAKTLRAESRRPEDGSGPLRERRARRPSGILDQAVGGLCQGRVLEGLADRPGSADQSLLHRRPFSAGNVGPQRAARHGGQAGSPEAGTDRRAGHRRRCPRGISPPASESANRRRAASGPRRRVRPCASTPRETTSRRRNSSRRW